MDVHRMREAFLRELLILTQTPQQPSATNNINNKPIEKQKEENNYSVLQQIILDQQPIQEKTIEEQDNSNTNLQKKVDITFLSDSGSSVGRTLSGLFAFCDTNLTHILINDLKTPIGTQSSALLRLNDVIAITYR